MKLVDDWKNFHKWWSTRLEALAIALFSLLTGAPDAIKSAWHFIPDDVRATFNPHYIQWGGIALLVLAVVCKLVHQPGLDTKADIGVGPESKS